MAEQGEIIQLNVQYSQPNASDLFNVFHWRLDEGADDGDVVDALVEWIEEEWGAEWAAIAATSASIIGIIVKVVTNAGLVDRVLGAEVLDIDGTQGGDITEAGSSWNITGYTAIPKVRGRKFMPGLSDSNVVSGLLDSNVVAAQATLAQTYVTPWVATNGVRLSPGVRRVNESGFVAFAQSIGFTNIPRSQRRRQPDVGA